MTDDRAIDAATAKLEHERDACIAVILEFMRAAGVRFSTVPPRIFERLTQFGARCVDIGQELAHEKFTVPAAPNRDPAIDAALDNEVTAARRPHGRRKRP